MARYLLVQVDRNDTADRLREKLDAVKGLKVIAAFAKPTRFCECEVKTEDSTRGDKLGWWICGACRLPKAGVMQHPRNLLEEDEHGEPIPSRFVNAFLTVREPYSTGLERVGQDAIDVLRANVLKNRDKAQRSRRRRSRGHQRDMQRGM
jgi:hypothetical protein